jgi:hypothetical protein
MHILSVIYRIPPPPHSPSPVFSPSMSSSTDSTRPSSPGSPSSESSDHHLRPESSATSYDDVDSRRFSQETARYHGGLFESRDSPEGMLSSRFLSYILTFVTFVQSNHPNTIIHTLLRPRGCPNHQMTIRRRLCQGRLQSLTDQRLCFPRVLAIQPRLLPALRAGCDRGLLRNSRHLLPPLKVPYLPHPINQSLISI